MITPTGIIAWSPGVTLEQVERQVILKAMEFYHRNKTMTANALGIAIRTLDAKLEKYESDDRKRIEYEKSEAAKRTDFLNRQRGPGQSPPNTTAEDQERQRTSVLPSAASGVRMESTPQVAAQPTVSVSKPKEVQEVLSGKASAGHTKRTG